MSWVWTSFATHRAPLLFTSCFSPSSRSVGEGREESQLPVDDGKGKKPWRLGWAGAGIQTDPREDLRSKLHLTRD